MRYRRQATLEEMQSRAEAFSLHMQSGSIVSSLLRGNEGDILIQREDKAWQAAAAPAASVLRHDSQTHARMSADAGTPLDKRDE